MAIRTYDTQLPLLNPQGTDAEMLLSLQRETFDYFLKEVDPTTGLIADSTQPGAPASVTVVGMGLSAYVAGVDEGFLSRGDAVSRVLKILQFFDRSVQGTGIDATGYRGFYYHFLEMATGRRAWTCELSTIDTAFLMAGILTAANYFTDDSSDERQIREIADRLYRRVDWQWARNGQQTLSHGWTPEHGFLPYHWDRDLSEAHLLYVLALGSPTFPIEPVGYEAWTNTFRWQKIYDIEYLYAGPLFIHQFSHLWIDFRGIHDDFNRLRKLDYFENSRRATYVQRQYAILNPHGFEKYGARCWGFTASDGPGNISLTVKGVPHEFFDYLARGVPFGPDDGTVSPWAVVASLPFAPEIVIDTIRHAIERLDLKHHRLYGFDASFNPTFPENSSRGVGWVSPWRFGLNQGPIVMMLQNFKSELIWSVIKNCKYVVQGLKRAGFLGGWLDDFKPELKS